MKQLLTALLLVLGVSAQAQNAVAKIKFEEAEEAYAKADFLTAVAKLDEAEKLLGSTNPKILYLLIMSQDKILDGDSSVLIALRKNCQYYLKSYENNPNLGEKYKDVHTVSERLLQYESNADFQAGDQAFKSKDYLGALQHFQKAAASGFARAMTYIGIMNLYGYGTEKNLEEARKWFERSAEKGNGYGQYWLGEAFYYGYGGEKNREQALQLYQQAASKNVVRAFTSLGNIYYEMSDYKNALDWYKKSADKNDGYAQFKVGYFYLLGLTVQKDKEAAFDLFKKAVDNGYLETMAEIGSCYQHGYGVPKDYSQAFHWYSKAADQGLYKGMMGLSDLYEEGWGVKKDKKKAKEWLEKGRAAYKAKNMVGK